MPGWLIVLVLLAAYLVLVQWVLPKFGIST